MEIKPIFIIDLKPKLINNYERKIYEAIAADKDYFYLELFNKLNNAQERFKLKEARNNLIKLGLLITVIDTDIKPYLIKEFKEIPKGKLINISAHGYFRSYEKYIKSGKAKYPILPWFELWNEAYNSWAANYFSKIKHSL